MCMLGTSWTRWLEVGGHRQNPCFGDTWRECRPGLWSCGLCVEGEVDADLGTSWEFHGLDVRLMGMPGLGICNTLIVSSTRRHSHGHRGAIRRLDHLASSRELLGLDVTSTGKLDICNTLIVAR
jgi:hypothetical protein